MTPLSTLLAFFPALVVGIAGYLLVGAVVHGSLWRLVLAVLVVYAGPLLAYRAHERVHPLVEGKSHVVGGPYSPWWGGHQIQLVFIAFPVLETVLRLVPGLFAWWLRQWGSTVGARVYFTPHLQIGDRALLEIGDDVIFGHQVGISSHLVKKTRKNVLLYVKRVRIEQGAFLGAGVIIGPGVVVEEGAVIDAGAHLYPNTRYGRVRRPKPAARDGDGSTDGRAEGPPRDDGEPGDADAA